MTLEHLNNHAIELIAMKMHLDKNGVITHQTHRTIQEMIKDFGDGMMPLDFYHYIFINKE